MSILTNLGLCHLRFSPVRKKLLNAVILKYSFSSSSIRYLFFESHPKGGYQSKDEPSQLQMLKEGFKQLKIELKLFKQEIITKFEDDPIINYPPGVIDKQWEVHFQEHLDQWTVTSDSDHGEGFSACDFTINPLGKGLFSGYLNTEVPKDGVIKRSGYCSIRTKRARKSFKRDAYLNWSPYTHLVIKCRGDGRSYMLNIATSGYFDQLWNDSYHYILYTRGGPYWQMSKIPFSKFFFASKGRIQDFQGRINLEKVTNFGITAGDQVNGSFALEIDYIGLEFDPNFKEQFAYEMYRLPKNLVGQ